MIFASWDPSNSTVCHATCIIAVDATTGRMAWYYQKTPHDSWDFDAVQKMVLADMTVDGAPRCVIMQASKNGFLLRTGSQDRASCCPRRTMRS